MSQKGAQRAFIGPELPSGPSRTARLVDQIGQTQKKKKKPLPPPLLELRGTSGKYSNSSNSRSGQAGKVWFRAMSNLCTHLIPYFFCPRFACQTPENPKILFTLYRAMRISRTTWRNPFEHRNT